MPEWFVYVLVSLTTHRTYVGVTNDLRRRLDQHNGILPGGAKSTRQARPWRVGCTHGPFDTKGEALSVEFRLKKFRGLERLRVSADRVSRSESA
jgi:putative endonuclease